MAEWYKTIPVKDDGNLVMTQMPSHRHKIHKGSTENSTPVGRVTQYDQHNDNGFKDDNIIENSGASWGWV